MMLSLVVMFVEVALFIMMMVMSFLVVMSAHRARLICQRFQLGLQSRSVFHSSQDLLSIQLSPRRGNHSSFGVLFTNQCHDSVQFFLRKAVGSA